MQTAKDAGLAAPPELGADLKDHSAKITSTPPAQCAAQPAEVVQPRIPDAQSHDETDLSRGGLGEQQPSMSIRSASESTQRRAEQAGIPSWCQDLGLDRDVKIFNRLDLQASRPSSR